MDFTIILYIDLLTISLLRFLTIHSVIVGSHDVMVNEKFNPQPVV